MFKSSMCQKRIPTLFRCANIVAMIQRFNMGPFNIINHPKDCIQSMEIDGFALPDMVIFDVANLESHPKSSISTGHGFHIYIE